MISSRILKAFALVGTGTSSAVAEEGEKSAEEIAASLANPNTPLATLNVKNQFRFFEGDLPNSSQSGFTTVFQPGLPFVLENGDKLIWRPAVPFVFDQPVFRPSKRDFDSESGVGDISFDLIYAPSRDDDLIIGGGIFSTVPTATNSDLTTGRWSIGPEFVLGKITKTSVVGGLFFHQWDVAGWTDTSVNVSNLQFFGVYLPGGGWNLGSSPIFTYDWTSEQWTVPLNFTFGKTIIVGEQPWKLSAEINYYVEKSDAFGAEWMVSLNFAPVVENVLAKWFQ